LSKASPKQFLKVLDEDESFKRAIDEFWPEQKEMLDGAKEYLRLTAAADDIGKGVGMTAAMAASGKSMATGWIKAVIGSTAAVAGAAKAHESDIVRDLMLNLHHAKGAPDLTQIIMGEIRPYMTALTNQVADEGRDPFAAEIEKTTTEKFLETTGQAGMDVLRAVRNIKVFGGDEEEEDPAARLNQMQGEMEE
jgi:hypothetical protein